MLAFLVGRQGQFRSIGSHILDMCMFGMHQRFLGVFGSGKAAPDENVDFASVKPSFGMPCVDANNLQDGIGPRSGGTFGWHEYMAIG